MFPNELESQDEYEGFSEWLDTFELFRGKKLEEEYEDESRVVGKFKVDIYPFDKLGTNIIILGSYQSLQASPAKRLG